MSARFRIEQYSTVGWTYYYRTGRNTIINHALTCRSGRVRLMFWADVRGTAPKSPLYQRAIGYYKKGILRDRLRGRPRVEHRRWTTAELRAA